MEKIKVDILNNYYEKDGVFDKDEAIRFCGRLAGVCYNREGYSKLANEDVTKTDRRVDLTINNGHHSVYDHVNITLNIQNIPKILAMILNNEHVYTTSEKSARYTPIVRNDDSIITYREEVLYNKWLEVFKLKIKKEYGDIYDDNKITKLAQENARYLVTVFMPTKMIYTVSLRQINYIASWLLEYAENCPNSYMNKNLKIAIYQFVEELERLNILDKRLMNNEKHRKLSLFNDDIENKRTYFGDTYSINYNASWAYLAQAQRHKTLDYQMKRLDNLDYYVPPILKDDEFLVKEWLNDIKSVSYYVPQGELIKINESGSYDNFILKCKERLCSAAQLEIMQKTDRILNNYQHGLEITNHPLADDIKKYTKGMRCTFPDFECSNPTCNPKIRRKDRKI